MKLFSEELRGKIEMCYGTSDSWLDTSIIYSEDVNFNSEILIHNLMNLIIVIIILLL